MHMYIDVKLRHVLTIDGPWQNFQRPEIGTKSQKEAPLIWRYSNFLKTQSRICQRKLPGQKKLARSVQQFR